MSLKPPMVRAELPEIRWREELSTTVNDLFSHPIVTVTTTYTAKYRDRVVLADATGGAFTVTLPTAVGHKGERLRVKRINTAANNVTVDGAGAETIDGSATYTLNVAQMVVHLISDGANWRVI